MKTAAVVAGLLAGIGLAQGQVTITSQDMFNTVGQYYRVYANKNSVDVTGRLGTTGGPQTWDFTSGPQDLIYRFDYVNTNDVSAGIDFPLAKFAERQTDEAAGTAMAWMFMQQVSGKGRINYGFCNPGSDPTEGVFDPPITDFPDPLKYQGSWTCKTSYSYNFMELIPVIENYTATATVDAYGTIKLPGLGSLSCLRINELDQHDFTADVDDSGDYQTLETDYIRLYFFVSPGHGIVATIDSQQSITAPPANDFTSASQFTRMFDFNHSGPAPAAVTDLTVTSAGTALLLNWSKAARTTSYRVEYLTGLGGTNAWRTLGTTTNDFLLDATLGNTAQRYYRVVSLGP
jgi:hypothetical protein